MFFVAPDGNMMAVPVNTLAGTRPSFEVGVPVALFATTMPSVNGTSNYQYDVTGDGNRFLIANSIITGASAAPTLTVVTNGLAGLNPRSP